MSFPECKLIDPTKPPLRSIIPTENNIQSNQGTCIRRATGGFDDKTIASNGRATFGIFGPEFKKGSDYGLTKKAIETQKIGWTTDYEKELTDEIVRKADVVKRKNGDIYLRLADRTIVYREDKNGDLKATQAFFLVA